MTPQKKILLGCIGIVILFIVGIVYVETHKTNIVSNVEDIVYSPEERAVRRQVDRFGNRLKGVSLLAPSSILTKEMTQEYERFLSPELLAEWIADPSKAIGRETSSPWPDRIEVSSVNKQNDTMYVIEAQVIEVTETTDEPVAVYSVIMSLELINEEWLITHLEKGEYEKTAEKVTITGTSECLPPAKAREPETLECALGIKDSASGLHYGVDLSGLPEDRRDFPTGVRMSAEGVLVEIDYLRELRWEKYDIVGTISVSKLSNL